MDIHEMIEEFMRSIPMRGVAWNTAREYRKALAEWSRLAQEPATAEEFVTLMFDRDRTFSTCQAVAQRVARFLHWRRRNYGKPDPSAGWKEAENMPAPPRSRPKLPKIPSPEQITEVFQATPLKSHRCILMCAYGMGLRRAEIAALDILDVKGSQVRVQGKGGRERLVPCPQAIRKPILELRLAREMELLQHGEKNGPLFTNDYTGGRLTEWTVWAIVKAAGKRAGVELRPHLLRHAFATHLIDAGTPIEKVSALMGHASIATTWRYTHLVTRQGDVDRLPIDLGEEV